MSAFALLSYNICTLYCAIYIVIYNIHTSTIYTNRFDLFCLKTYIWSKIPIERSNKKQTPIVFPTLRYQGNFVRPFTAYRLLTASVPVF